jgi:hypothetical protein
LNHTHGNDPDEDEPDHIGIQFKKIGQQANREEADDWPEEDLEEAEHIPLRDDPILNPKRPYLNQSPL